MVPKVSTYEVVVLRMAGNRLDCKTCLDLE